MNRPDYILLRSKRRTLSVIVCDGKVTVKAPMGMPTETIERFLTEKKGWLEKKLNEQARAAARFLSVKEGRTLLVAGIEKPVFFGAAKNEERDGAFYLKNERSVRVYFEKTRDWLLVECLYEYAKGVRRPPSEVSVCDFKAKWGSCDAAGHIKLNWRLTMLPLPLSEYVLIHELAHLQELNHSAAFWKEVHRLCPDYRERRKLLKDYSFLTLLYRQK